MELSTVLTLSLFCYGIFMILLAIEYFSDKSRKQMAPNQKIPLKKIEDLQSRKLRIQNTTQKHGKLLLMGLLCSSLSLILFYAAVFWHTDESGRSWILFHARDLFGAYVLSAIGFFLIAFSIFIPIIWQRAPPQEIHKPEENNAIFPELVEDLEREKSSEPEREELKDKKYISMRRWIDVIFNCENCIKSSTGVQPCEEHSKIWDELIGVAEEEKTEAPKDEKAPESPAIWKHEEFE